MSSRRSGAVGGFTMVELLVTMLLLSIVLMGLAALQVHAVRNVTASRRINEAMRLGQSVLERYRQSIAPPAAHAWNTEIGRDGATMSNVAADGENRGPYTVETMVENPSSAGAGTALITARVRWMEVTPTGAASDYKEQQLVLTTLKVP